MSESELYPTLHETRRIDALLRGRITDDQRGELEMIGRTIDVFGDPENVEPNDEAERDAWRSQRMIVHSLRNALSLIAVLADIASSAPSEVGSGKRGEQA